MSRLGIVDASITLRSLLHWFGLESALKSRINLMINPFRIHHRGVFLRTINMFFKKVVLKMLNDNGDNDNGDNVRLTVRDN